LSMLSLNPILSRSKKWCPNLKKIPDGRKSNRLSRHSPTLYENVILNLWWCSRRKPRSSGHGCCEGICVGGGIAPKIICKLKDKGFMKAFKGKGRLSEVLAHISIIVIMNDNAVLLGAASYAIKLLEMS